MTQEALKLALDFLLTRRMGAELVIDALQEALAKEQEPVAHSVIAGALFDFIGWLTSRKERIVLSSADNASPAVDAIRDFANMRGLSLDDAKVLDWNTTPPQRTWVGLTDDELTEAWHWGGCDPHIEGAHFKALYQYFEAKLKDKNHVAQETN